MKLTQQPIGADYCLYLPSSLDHKSEENILLAETPEVSFARKSLAVSILIIFRNDD